MLADISQLHAYPSWHFRSELHWTDILILDWADINLHPVLMSKRCQTLVQRWANIGPTLIQPKKIVPCNSNVVYIGPVLVRAMDDR